MTTQQTGSVNDQPEALVLANLLDLSVLQLHADAAAELRRLYEANQELLEALKKSQTCLIAALTGGAVKAHEAADAIKDAGNAIAKVEGRA